MACFEHRQVSLIHHGLQRGDVKQETWKRGINSQASFQIQMKAACWELPSHCRERITLLWMVVRAGNASGLSLQLGGWWKRTRMQLDARDASTMLTCGFGHVTELLSASSPVKWWFSPNGLWFLLSLRSSNFRIGVRKIKPRHSIASGRTSHVSTPTVYLPLFCELCLCYHI